MKNKILFVDDEAMILNGLKRMLHPYKNEWDMIFVDSGHKALEAMAQSPFDVIVADMRMPLMSGAELLSQVMQKYPETVRIILSGHSDKEMIFKSIGVTHQYLAKPCNPEVIQAVIKRAIASRDILHDQELLSLVGRMTTLPSLPALYFEIMQKIHAPDVQLEDVTGIISRDIGMTAKIMQLVNSAYFGHPNRLSDLSSAVSYLGFNVITALCISVHAFSICENIHIPGLSINRLWQHSLETALLARKIALLETKNNDRANDAFIAGILHDSGRLVLATNFPEQYQEVIDMSGREQCQISTAEKTIFGHTHSAIGCYLLTIWGLPVPVVESVSFHHSPGLFTGPASCALTAVHAANSLVGSCFLPADQIPPDNIDMDYLKSLNLLNRLPVWKELALPNVCEGGFPAKQPA